MIKHISLDLWNTLLISNPNFSVERVKYFSKNYLSNINNDIISKEIENIGIETDLINMSEGISIPSEKMYSKLLFKQQNLILDESELKTIYSDLELIFLKNLPFIMYNIDSLKECFENLLSKDYSLNISSNTAYIKGKTLINVLEKLELKQYFSFFIFSDEINFSKPSKKFFEKLLKNCGKLKINKENIIHIGDSIEADISGANRCEIKSHYVDKNERKLVDFLNSL
jgi:putative hydrolase of the HAD superfamily